MQELVKGLKAVSMLRIAGENEDQKSLLSLSMRKIFVQEIYAEPS